MCPSNLHIAGYIASKPVTVCGWNDAIRAFALVVDDFNVRGQREQVDHPGWVVHAQFCSQCGAAINHAELRLISLGNALLEIERKMTGKM